MAPGPFLRYRLSELVARQGEFCPGLHATLNSEWAGIRWGPVLAVSDVSSLVREDGTFHNSTQTLHERGVVSEMLGEISAQLDLVRSLGLRPRYLETHMVFTWIPGVTEALAGLCQSEGLIFANGPGFSSLPLDVEVTPGELAGALGRIASTHPGTRPVWVSHPAKRDEFSERFFSEPGQPSASVAESLREFAIFSDAVDMASLARAANVQPSEYAH